MEKFNKNGLQTSKTALKKVLALVGFGVGLAAASTSSHAQFAVDTSEITAGISTVATAVGTIGAAIVLVYLGIRAYKWIRAALS